MVFQVTPRGGRFRLTQFLFADDRAQARDRAQLMYHGVPGTLEIRSAVELQMIADDLAAAARCRVAPKEEGERRPHMTRRTTYGECVFCGALTQAFGGKPPKYCAAHRDRAHQRLARALRDGIATVTTRKVG